MYCTVDIAQYLLRNLNATSASDNINEVNLNDDDTKSSRNEAHLTETICQ